MTFTETLQKEGREILGANMVAFEELNNEIPEGTEMTLLRIGETYKNLDLIISETIQKTLEEVKKDYDPIFKWLLGENGDFPDLSEKPHYKFRTELRDRLAHLKETNTKI